ncbi:MAG: hypothetical protein ACXVBQ_15780 [Pseudobdellovibrionaceae bacterium]
MDRKFFFNFKRPDLPQKQSADNELKFRTKQDVNNIILLYSNKNKELYATYRSFTYNLKL